MTVRTSVADLRLIYHREGINGVARTTFRRLGEAGALLSYRTNIWSQQSSEELPTILHTDPSSLHWKTTFSKRQFPTKDRDVRTDQSPFIGIFSGPWDRFKRPWDSSLHHRSLVMRFVKGQPWQSTPFYKKNLRRIQSGLTGEAGVATVEELDARCEEIDALHRSIHDYGYRSQTELLEDGALPRGSSITIDGREYPNECRVGIGRDGEFIRFSGGRHRLSLAKILDIEAVPVLVVLRHARWERIREFFERANSVDEVPEAVLQYKDHPDIHGLTPE